MVFSSIKFRIFAGLLVVLGAFTAAILYNLSTNRRIQFQINRINVGYVPLTRLLSSLSVPKPPGPSDIDALLFIKIMDQHLEEARRLIHNLQPTLKSNLESRALKEVTAFISAITQEIDRARAAVPADRRLLIARIIRIRDQKLNPLMLSLESIIRIQSRTIEVLEAQSFRINLALLTISILIATIFMVTIFRTLNGITRLSAAAALIGEGHYDAPLPRTSRDEVGILGNALGEMARSLSQREIELREQQQRLSRSERLAVVGRLSAQITHEIRNPLNSIGLKLEMLTDQIRSAKGISKTAIDLVQSIDHEIDRLNRVAEGYLQKVRPPHPEPTLFSVNSVLRSVAETFTPELKGRRIQLLMDFDSENPRIQADPDHIRQAFLNLLKNAIEAIQPGQIRPSLIRISTVRKNDRVQITIQDTGSGIAPEDLAKIFQPLYTTKADGTGLGLSVTEQLIQANGGRLFCQSKLQEGTTFMIDLPAVQPDDTVLT